MMANRNKITTNHQTEEDQPQYSRKVVNNEVILDGKTIVIPNRDLSISNIKQDNNNVKIKDMIIKEVQLLIDVVVLDLEMLDQKVHHQPILIIHVNVIFLECNPQKMVKLRKTVK